MWLPSLGAPMQQVHDFNPGIGSTGLFWLVQVPDDAVQISDDGNTLTISLTNVPVVDQFSFPNGAGNNLGHAGVPATVSFHATYTKTAGTRRHVQPASTDPLSPFSWAGEMWDATNSGGFSVAYNDGSFSAQGTFSSSGNFGEMGTERNGSFVTREDGAEVTAVAMAALRAASTSAMLAAGQSAPLPATSAKFKGKVPVEYLIH